MIEVCQKPDEPTPPDRFHLLGILPSYDANALHCCKAIINRPTTKLYFDYNLRHIPYQELHFHRMSFQDVPGNRQKYISYEFDVLMLMQANPQPYPEKVHSLGTDASVHTVLHTGKYTHSVFADMLPL